MAGLTEQQAVRSQRCGQTASKAQRTGGVRMGCSAHYMASPLEARAKGKVQDQGQGGSRAECVCGGWGWGGGGG